MYLNTSDEFELKFSSSSRAEKVLSRAGALQFPSWNWAEFFYALVRIFQFCTCIIDISNSNDHLSKLKGIFGVEYYHLAT